MKSSIFDLVHLAQSRGTRDATRMLMATTVGQVISFFAAPVITRIYSPAPVGELATFVSVSLIVSVVAAGRYELAIPIPEDVRRAVAIALTGIAIASAAAVASLVIISSCTVLPIPRLSDIPSWWLFFPFMVAAFGIRQIFSYWQTRARGFGLIAISQIVRSAGTVALQIGLGLAIAPKAAVLIAGAVAGHAFAVVPLVLGAVRQGFFRIAREITKRDVRREFTANIDFLKYSGPQAVVNSASQNLVVILLTLVFTASSAGLFALAYRVMMVPTYLIGNAVRQVYYERACRAGDFAALYRIWRRMTILLWAMGLPIFVVVGIWGPALFEWYLGAEWRLSGLVARIIAPMLLMAFVNPPSTMSIPLVQRQRWHFGYEIVVLAFRVVALLTGVMTGRMILSLVLYSAVGTAANLWLVLRVRRFILEGRDLGRSLAVPSDQAR